MLQEWGVDTISAQVAIMMACRRRHSGGGELPLPPPADHDQVQESVRPTIGTNDVQVPTNSDHAVSATSADYLPF